MFEDAAGGAPHGEQLEAAEEEVAMGSRVRRQVQRLPLKRDLPSAPFMPGPTPHAIDVREKKKKSKPQDSKKRFGLMPG